MSKHKKHKREYRDYGDYEDISGGNNNFDMNSIASILGNIDINQVASLLNVLGGFNNQSQNNLSNLEGFEGQNDAIKNQLQDINIGELMNEAANINNAINNSLMKNVEDEEKIKESKSKSKSKRKRNTEGIEGNEDEIIILLNSIKSLVNEEKSQKLDRLISIYKEGKV